MLRTGLAAAALIVALAAAGWADTDTPAEKPLTATPSLLGPSGCIVTPTTDIAGLTYTGGFHWVNHTFDGISKANVAPIDQLELGLAYIKPNDPAISSHVVFNAKYLFTKEHKSTPAVAAGVWDIGNQVDQAFYGVVSKTFGSEVPVIVNLGGATGKTILNGFFANMTIRLRPQIDVLTEWDSQEFNFGLRLRPYHGLTVDLLAIDNGSSREFGAGGSYCARF